MSKLILWIYNNNTPITLSLNETITKEKSEKIIKYLFDSKNKKIELKTIYTEYDYFSVSTKSIVAAYLICDESKIGSKISIWIKNNPSPIIIYTGEMLSSKVELSEMTNEIIIPKDDENNPFKIIKLKTSSCFGIKQNDIQCISITIQKVKIDLFETSTVISKVLLPLPDNNINISEKVDFDIDVIDNEQIVNNEIEIIPIPIIFDDNIFFEEVI